MLSDCLFELCNDLISAYDNYSDYSENYLDEISDILYKIRYLQARLDSLCIHRPLEKRCDICHKLYDKISREYVEAKLG